MNQCLKVSSELGSISILCTQQEKEWLVITPELRPNTANSGE